MPEKSWAQPSRPTSSPTTRSSKPLFRAPRPVCAVPLGCKTRPALPRQQPSITPDDKTIGWGARIRTWEWRNQNQPDTQRSQRLFPQFLRCSYHSSSRAYHLSGTSEPDGSARPRLPVRFARVGGLHARGSCRLLLPRRRGSFWPRGRRPLFVIARRISIGGCTLWRCYRAAVSQYHRTAVVQHRHQGVLTGAGAPPNEALHSAPALLSAVAVRVGHRGLHPAAVVSHQCMGMALHPAPARPLSGTGTGASHPNR
jgi:hypothetical protein